MYSLIMFLKGSSGIMAARSVSTLMLKWTLCQFILLAELPVKLQYVFKWQLQPGFKGQIGASTADNTGNSN